MSHRIRIVSINNITELRKVPKKSASERTWFRWRDRHSVLLPHDMERKSLFEKIKEKIIREKVEAEAMKNR